MIQKLSNNVLGTGSKDNRHNNNTNKQRTNAANGKQNIEDPKISMIQHTDNTNGGELSFFEGSKSFVFPGVENAAL